MTMTSIHAHTVLNLLLAAETPYSEQSLQQAITAEYGEDVRFHTCSLQDLTLEALLIFFLERGKVIREGDAIVANPAMMCSH
ncbi:YecH family metal-binding protein [Photobacterium atrarenae]|uniref:YecH family protein n=1 Tax=Photobacterium atrarenae TaxID=865757 RepID=A0ABY5GF00_9GAMM|nr:YecH family metal-binding protein [Photobacterium atrarenae]UTV27833.1 YecH family protein [Photobacterium atrarenae]